MNIMYYRIYISVFYIYFCIIYYRICVIYITEYIYKTSVLYNIYNFCIPDILFLISTME